MTGSSNFFVCLFLSRGLAILPFETAEYFLALGCVNEEASLLSLYWLSFMAVACTPEMSTKCHIWCLPFCHIG